MDQRCFSIKWKFHKKNHNVEIDEGYFFEVDIQYLEKLDELDNDLPFLPKVWKVKKLKT